MSEMADSMGRDAPAPAADPAAMERRIFRYMCAAVALSLPLSAIFAPWRVTAGLLVGGILSLFNHHWLRTSIAAAFACAGPGRRPKLKIARYVLRYFIVAAVVAGAYWLDLVSLVATLAGLCSFGVAALVEASMQTYFAIAHREDNP
jgi:hypothetical protein